MCTAEVWIAWLACGQCMRFLYCVKWVQSWKTALLSTYQASVLHTSACCLKGACFAEHFVYLYWDQVCISSNWEDTSHSAKLLWYAPRLMWVQPVVLLARTVSALMFAGVAMQRDVYMYACCFFDRWIPSFWISAAQTASPLFVFYADCRKNHQRSTLRQRTAMIKW